MMRRVLAAAVCLTFFASSPPAAVSRPIEMSGIPDGLMSMADPNSGPQQPPSQHAEHDYATAVTMAERQHATEVPAAEHRYATAIITEAERHRATAVTAEVERDIANPPQQAVCRSTTPSPGITVDISMYVQ